MSLETSIGFKINSTGRKISQWLAERFQPHDITPEQWSVLHSLCVGDGITPKELARRSDKDQPNVSRILDQLEQKALVRRAAHPEDRRSLLVYATDRGIALNRLLTPIEASLMEEICAGLSSEERQNMWELLDKVHQNASCRGVASAEASGKS